MELFSPCTLRHISLKNRAVLAPMVINSAAEDGSVTPEFRDFYLARAMGGVGTVIFGATFVHEDGRGFNRQLGISRDEHISGLAGLAESVKQHARIGVQLSFKGLGRTPQSYILREIDTYRKAFVKAAIRAKRCGFDAVELHACHEYWLSFFLSAYFNRRTDAYGGSLKNRFRLLRETVEGIRSAAPDDLLLGVRLGMTDFVEGGQEIHEALEVGQLLEELGVDYLSVSAGIGSTQFRMSPPMEIPRSSLLILARALRESVVIPVMGVGRLDRPDRFREAIRDGYVQLAAAGRALIADPEFVAKLAAGREAEIRPCIACNHCLQCLHEGKAVRCVVNPFVGRDLIRLQPLPEKPRVVVVGGGPAGLTAAAAAGRRGARVRLLERTHELGGTLNTAKLPPFKAVLQDLIDYLADEVHRAGVQVQLGSEATPEALAEEEADAIILATGAKPLRPEIAEQGRGSVFLAEEVLRLEEIPFGRYLVVGGGLVGLETAEHLCRGGAEVTVIEMRAELGKGLALLRLRLVRDRLLKSGANLLTRAKFLGIQGGMAQVSLPAGTVSMGPYQAVVFAAGYERRTALLERSDETAVKTRAIGDAVEPRSIREAIEEGFQSAMQLEALVS